MIRLLPAMSLFAIICIVSAAVADEVGDRVAKDKKDDSAQRDGERPADRDAERKARRNANGKQADTKKRGAGEERMRRRPNGSPTEMIQRMIKMADKDKDGKISKAEAPERMKDRFDRIDANKDGFLDKKEQTALIERLSTMAAQQNGKDKDSSRPRKAQGKKRDRRIKDANAENVKPKRPPAE